MTEIFNPHDSLFKHSMQDKKTMQQWLQAHLSEKTLSYLRLDSLVLAPNEFLPKISDKLFSDIVYSCKIKRKPGYIFIAAEHQSTPAKDMAFRVLQYSIEIMSNHLKQGHKKLPVVLPIILYNGARTPYPYTLDIFDCFENPDLARELALKDAQLVDLTTTPDEQIIRSARAAPMELLLKHYRIQQSRAFLVTLLETITTFFPEDEIKYTREFSRYFFVECNNPKDPKKLEQAIELWVSYMPKMKEEIMTFAQQLEQKGRQEGRQEMVMRMLQDNMPIDRISRISGLSEEEIAKLRKEQAN